MVQSLVDDTESKQNYNALVVSRFRTVNPPHGYLVLSGVSICVSPNRNIVGMTFVSRLTFDDHVRGSVSRVS